MLGLFKGGALAHTIGCVGVLQVEPVGKGIVRFDEPEVLQTQTARNMTRKVLKVPVRLDAKGTSQVSHQDLVAILRAADPLIMSGGDRKSVV